MDGALELPWGFPSAIDETKQVFSSIEMYRNKFCIGVPYSDI